MTLEVRARIAGDINLIRRIAACAAACGIPEYPTSWADRRVWVLAAEPGWTDAYEGDAWVDTNGDRFLWVKRGTVWVRERLTDDTGWKTIPLLPSYVAHQGTPMYRILNDVLYLKGTLRRTSGNMPNSGQTTISHPIPDLTARGFSGDSYDPALCVGPTGGTLFRVYLSEDNELRYGGSAGYGTGVASYVSLAGASGVWAI